MAVSQSDAMFSFQSIPKLKQERYIAIVNLLGAPVPGRNE